MIGFLLATAHAADAPVPMDDGHSVTAVVAAIPFQLARAEVWTMTATPYPVTEGVLLELRADPALLLPKDAGGAVLYVGDTPAWQFNWDHVGGCVVAWVPGAPDLATTEIYFGSPELPERVDAARGAAERAAARARGVRPLNAAQVARALAPSVALDGFPQLAELIQRRVDACTATPEDHLRHP